MNETLWNSAEEAVGQFALAGVVIFLHGYAIFLCSAIYEYEDEKPNSEKGPIDVHIQDFNKSSFLFFIFVFINGKPKKKGITMETKYNSEQGKLSNYFLSRIPQSFIHS